MSFLKLSSPVPASVLRNARHCSSRVLCALVTSSLRGTCLCEVGPVCRTPRSRLGSLRAQLSDRYSEGLAAQASSAPPVLPTPRSAFRSHAPVSGRAWCVRNRRLRLLWVVQAGERRLRGADKQRLVPIRMQTRTCAFGQQTRRVVRARVLPSRDAFMRCGTECPVSGCHPRYRWMSRFCVCCSTAVRKRSLQLVRSRSAFPNMIVLAAVNARSVCRACITDRAPAVRSSGLRILAG